MGGEAYYMYCGRLYLPNVQYTLNKSIFSLKIFNNGDGLIDKEKRPIVNTTGFAESKVQMIKT